MLPLSFGAFTVISGASSIHDSFLIVFFLVIAISFIAFRLYQYYRPKRASSLSEPSSLHQLDPFLGLDIVIASYRRLRLHEFLQLCQERFAQAGNTYACRIPGSRIVVTCEPENVKALLATQFQDFELGHRRRQAFRPLLGESIFASDGHIWKGARQQLRPSFIRDRLSDSKLFDQHVEVLITNIHIAQANNGTIDLQQLFFRLSLDVATAIFFGESCHSLSGVKSDSPAAKFATAFNRSLRSLVDSFVLGPFAKFVPNLQFSQDRRAIRNFAEKYVKIAIRASQSNKSGAHNGSILEDLARESDNLDQLRDQALSLLVAGRDTTASLLSNLWFVLYQRQDIWDRLQAAIESLNGCRPNMTELQGLKYLQACMRECKR